MGVRKLAAPLRDISEKDWDALLFGGRKGLATGLGFESYHTLRSKGSAPGYPDRTLWRDRVIFAELKAEKGQPTDRQIQVMNGIAKAGGEVYLWRPSDLDEIGRILGAPWRWDGSCLRRGNGHGHEDVWVPNSLWLHEHACRADDAFARLEAERAAREQPKQLAIPAASPSTL